jgi:hypothetical protein
MRVGGQKSEKLIVRWRTCGKGQDGAFTDNTVAGTTEPKQFDKLAEILGPESKEGEFSGIFIFEFDEEGRIVQHTIEHAEESGSLGKVGGVVGLTEWLLGKFGRTKEDEGLLQPVGIEGLDGRGRRWVP